MKETERMYLCLSQERIIQFQVGKENFVFLHKETSFVSATSMYEASCKICVTLAGRVTLPDK